MNNPMSRGPVLTRHALILATASLLSLSVHAATLTRDNGAAVGDNQNSQTAGATGPALLQDVQLIQKLQRFDRERIPERVVHARGTGAHGTFTVTDGLRPDQGQSICSRRNHPGVRALLRRGAWQPFPGNPA